MVTVVVIVAVVFMLVVVVMLVMLVVFAVRSRCGRGASASCKGRSTAGWNRDGPQGSSLRQANTARWPCSLVAKSDLIPVLNGSTADQYRALYVRRDVVEHPVHAGAGLGSISSA